MIATCNQANVDDDVACGCWLDSCTASVCGWDQGEDGGNDDRDEDPDDNWGANHINYASDGPRPSVRSLYSSGQTTKRPKTDPFSSESG